jgi:predicted ester cyclase
MVRAIGAGPDWHQAKEGAMAAEDNKAAVLRFYEEVINGTDLDVIDELLTPDGVDHTFGSQSAEEAKQFFGMLYQAFPDLRVEVNDVIAEGTWWPPG